MLSALPPQKGSCKFGTTKKEIHRPCKKEQRPEYEDETQIKDEHPGKLQYNLKECKACAAIPRGN